MAKINKTLSSRVGSRRLVNRSDDPLRRRQTSDPPLLVRVFSFRPNDGMKKRATFAYLQSRPLNKKSCSLSNDN